MEEREETGATNDDDVWEYVPVTVIGIVLCSTLFSLVGARPYTFYADGFNPLIALMNLVQTHLLNMFMHQGMGHYLGNMFFLVLFGGALTLLTSNWHVLGVAVVSHVVASVVFVFTQPQPFVIGASLALAGLIAATIVRAIGLARGRGTSGDARTVFGAFFGALVIGAFLLLSVTGIYYLRITDHHLAGWVAGGVLETGWLVAGDRLRETPLGS